MASTYLTRTNSGTGSTTASTISMWVKFCDPTSSQHLWIHYYDNNNFLRLTLESDSCLQIQTDLSNTTDVQKKSTRVFRDTNAWYHIVLAIDLSDSTQEDKYKLYINGERETVFQTNNLTANTSGSYVGGNSSWNPTFGRHPSGSGYFNGLMSHVHFCDGSALAPTVFGSTDSVTGEWNINTDPSFTPGTNGYSILKDGNTVTDSSANSNNFTVGGGSLTFTHDCPSNVLNTINRNAGNWLNLSSGALKAVNSNGATSNYNPHYFSNLGYAAGKFYWETKVSSFSTGTGHSVSLLRTNTGHIPSYGTDSTEDGTSMGNNTINYFFGENTTYFKKYGTNEQSGSIGSTLSSGDIIGMSHDVSAGEVKYFVNGSQIGNTITGASSANDGYFYIPYWVQEAKNSSRYCTMEWNFGNGYFGTTAISTNSGNGYAGAEGKSKFNYQPASGFCALSTKGLNT